MIVIIITNVIHLQLPVGKAMSYSLSCLLVAVTTASICDVRLEECTVYWSCVLFLMNSW